MPTSLPGVSPAQAATLDVPRLDAGGALAQDPAATVAAMNPTQHAAWSRFLAALTEETHAQHHPHPRRHVRLLALGDSLLGNSGGGYAKQFAAALEEHFGATVSFSNRARGGTPTEAALLALPTLTDPEPGGGADDSDGGSSSHLPTLVLMDFSINDSCLSDAPRLRAAVESAIRWMLTTRPSMPVLLVESWWGDVSQHVPSQVKQAYSVAARYGVPRFRYEQAVQPGHFEQAWGDYCLPGKYDARCKPHPGGATHQLLSTALLRTFAAISRSVCGDSFWHGGGCVGPSSLRFAQQQVHRPSQVTLPPAASEARLMQQVAVCTEPTASFLATAAASISNARGVAAPAHPRLLQGNWTLYEDRPGKPGWISTGPSGSTIEFDLAFGVRPTVTFSFLQSHDPSFGRVAVRMRNVWPTSKTPAAEWRNADAARMWEINRLRLHGQRSDGVKASTAAVMHMQVHYSIMQSHEMDGMHMRPPYEPNPYTWPDERTPGVMGYGIPAFANATLSVELLCDACKFKLLAVSAC